MTKAERKTLIDILDAMEGTCRVPHAGWDQVVALMLAKGHDLGAPEQQRVRLTALLDTLRDKLRPDKPTSRHSP